MIEFLLGGIAVADLVAAMLFMSFHRRTRDGFFLFLAAAFALDAATRVWMWSQDAYAERGPVSYASRLVVYALILAGIVYKNRARPRR